MFTYPIFRKKQQSGGSFLLDQYPGAIVGLSFKKLRSDYSGNNFIVRRTSDQDEDEFGFDGSGNTVLANILSFCGSGDGFIKRWYSQGTLGGYFEQTSTSLQPQIVSGGNLISLGGKNCLRAQADALVHDLTIASSVVNTGGSFSIFSEFTTLSSVGGVLFSYRTAGSNQTAAALWSDGKTYFDCATDSTPRFSPNLTWNNNTSLTKGTFARNGSAATIRKDSTQVASTTESRLLQATSTRMAILALSGGTIGINGYMSSFIWYPTFQTNFTQIEALL